MKMGDQSCTSAEKKPSNDVNLADNFTSLIPDTARGMKKLDKSTYDLIASLPAIKVNAKTCGKFLSVFKSVLLKRPNFRKTIPDPGEVDRRIIFLDPSMNLLDKLNEEQQKLIVEENATFCCQHDVPLCYKDFTFNEIIQSIIPEDAETISSFETIGHIAHINLKSHLDDFKFIIGEVLLDKNNHIKTVINKTNSINATFRFFEMELLAGENKLNASVNEHGCLFEFDYSKVYWNSRLQSEHKRLVDLVKSKDLVFDVFAGVGPFAIPAAKKKCHVFANDLNKVSYESLIHNAKLNKVDEYIQAFNMDGRDFITNNIISNLHNYKDRTCNLHVIMNLPAIAPEFLDVFKDTISNSVKLQPNIHIHCYCFSKSKTPKEDAETTVSGILGLDISSYAKTHFVRRVAPNKVMLCVSFNAFWFKEESNESSISKSVISQKRPLQDDGIVMSNKRPATTV